MSERPQRAAVHCPESNRANGVVPVDGAPIITVAMPFGRPQMRLSLSPTEINIFKINILKDRDRQNTLKIWRRVFLLLAIKFREN
ncbi:MAG TPA: hypothetical protein PLO69_09610 [Gammaproteobacteria bacterium]|nr:hypothetical protein [Gammaproteobacteria bacterium]